MRPPNHAPATDRLGTKTEMLAFSNGNNRYGERPRTHLPSEGKQRERPPMWCTSQRVMTCRQAGIPPHVEGNHHRSEKD